MKKNLFLTVVIAITALTFFGCQDPIKDLTITQTPGTAPEVAAESIIAEALSLGDGQSGILVKWDRAENGTTYNVWRREIDADNNPVDATAVVLSAPNAQGSTNVKQIPFYWDAAVKEGVKYQYGIVSETYKQSNDVIQKSDIVWQTVEDDAYAAGPAKQTAIKIIDNPATAPTIKLEAYNNVIDADGNKPAAPTASHTVSTIKVDGYKVTVSGLTYGYTYGIGIQTSTNAKAANSPTWPVWTGNANITWSGDDPTVTNATTLRNRYFTAKLEGYTYESVTFVGDVTMNSINLFSHGNNGSSGWYETKLTNDNTVRGIRPVVQYSASGTLNKLKITTKSDTTSFIEGKDSSDIVPFEGADQLFTY